MKKVLARSLVMLGTLASSVPAFAVCSAAYATDQQIVDHGPNELKLFPIAINSTTAIPGTDRSISIFQMGTVLRVSLSKLQTELATSSIAYYIAGSEVILDAPNSSFDEYVRVRCW